MGLTGVLVSRILSQQRVLPLRHRLKMARVHTHPVPAQVIQGQTVGNWASQQLPKSPMQHHVAAVHVTGKESSPNT